MSDGENFKMQSKMEMVCWEVIPRQDANAGEFHKNNLDTEKEMLKVGGIILVMTKSGADWHTLPTLV